MFIYRRVVWHFQLGDEDMPTNAWVQQSEDTDDATGQPSTGKDVAPTNGSVTGTDGGTPTNTDTEETTSDVADVPERPDTIDESVAVEYILQYVVQAQLEAFSIEATALAVSVSELAESPGNEELWATPVRNGELRWRSGNALK